MKKEIIKTENYLLVVDDFEVKENDWYINRRVIFMADDKFDEGNNPNQNKNNKKIIAHLPLNDAPILKGVPLLPPFEQEDDVEKLAEEEYPIIPNTSPNVNWDRANKQEGFERGYNKAREKYKFTEEDVINFACKVYNENYHKDDSFFTTAETLIKSFSQAKTSTPTHFEFEMEDKVALDGHTVIGKEIKTTNSQGQRVACGKYIY